MNRFTITPDTEPAEVAKQIRSMQVGDIVRIQQYGYTEKGGMDLSKSLLAMIVHRIVGGWIYEVMVDSDGLIWHPVFVPDQVDFAHAIEDGVYSAMNHLEYISVRQS